MQRVFGRDCENIAHGDALQINTDRRNGDDEEAEAEKAGKDQTDDHVGLEARALCEKEHGRRRQPSRKESAQRKGQAEHIGPCHTWHDRVRKRIADE